MRANWRRVLLRLWLVGTVVWLLGALIALRPDQDLDRYLKFQHAEISEDDAQARQLVTLIRVHRINGLAPNEIKAKLLDGGKLSSESADHMIELEMLLSAKDHARRQIIVFLAVALLPPLVLLVLGGGLAWATQANRR